MAPVKHTRSIHIDAPVERVFRYLDDPAHLVAAMPAHLHGSVGTVTRAPDGTVAAYEVRFSEYGMHLTTAFTREEYAVNERIVERSSLGPISRYAVEPDAAGSTLTFGWDASRLMTMLDAVSWHSERDVDNALATIKQGVEAMP